MKLHKLKVRPRKDAAAAPCATEFAAMLACWATSKDLNNTGACADSAKVLSDCMKNKPPNAGGAKAGINYHLARLGKRL